MLNRMVKSDRYISINREKLTLPPTGEYGDWKQSNEPISTLNVWNKQSNA